MLKRSALAALPAVADDNDFFYLTQPNGKKIIFAPISIVAIWRPPQGVCRGETQIVTGPMSFCVSDQPEDVIKKLQTFPCVETRVLVLKRYDVVNDYPCFLPQSSVFFDVLDAASRRRY